MTERGDWDEAVAILAKCLPRGVRTILENSKLPRRRLSSTKLLRRIQEGSSGQTQTAAEARRSQPAGG